MDNSRPLLEKAGETFGYFQDYVEKRLELLQLELTERVIRILSVLITAFLLLSIISLFLLFISISAAFFIGEHLGSPATGFLAVGGIFGLLALLLYVFRKPLIVQPILSMIIGEFREELMDEENPEEPLQAQQEGKTSQAN